MLVDGDERGVGWHRDPDDEAKFRYWDGSKWTARALTHTDYVSGIRTVSGAVQLRRRRVFDSRLFQNPVVFHVVAWFDCSVPLIRGRLGRFTTPVELRTLDQVRSGPNRP